VETQRFPTGMTEEQLPAWSTERRRGSRRVTYPQRPMLDDPPIVALFSLGFEDGVLKLPHFLVDEAVEKGIGHWKKLERAVRRDNRVVIPGGDARHRLLPVPRREMIPAGDEEVGLRIEFEKLRAHCSTK